MKAVLMDAFGGVEVLKVGEIEKPTPKEHEVLVKVVARATTRRPLATPKSSAWKSQEPSPNSDRVLRAGRSATGSYLWSAVVDTPSMLSPMPAT